MTLILHSGHFYLLFPLPGLLCLQISQGWLSHHAVRWRLKRAGWGLEHLEAGWSPLSLLVVLGPLSGSFLCASLSFLTAWQFQGSWTVFYGNGSFKKVFQQTGNFITFYDLGNHKHCFYCVLLVTSHQSTQI